MMKLTIVLLCLLLPRAVSAQPPVEPIADWVSWGTAFTNPTIAAYRAIRSDQPRCKLTQLAISELVGNGVSVGLKHLIHSPRPCLGCAPDGMPSGHSMNSVIGISSWRWEFGASFAWGTQALRGAANRHTPWQRAAGIALGGAAELAGHLVHCQDN